jgi:ribosomal protein S18 acetylase RimI-like enzyme
VIRIRTREAADLRLCVEILAQVYQTSGYPTNWPADPAGWLTPPGTVAAWVATSDDAPVAGHLILRQLPASPAKQAATEISRLFVAPAARRQGVAQALLDQAMHWATANGQDLVLEVTDNLQAAQKLYEQSGFRHSATKQADWTTPAGHPVTLYKYSWSRRSRSRPTARTRPTDQSRSGRGGHAGGSGGRPPDNSHVGQGE